MKKRKIYQVDAFTQSTFGGNPAGVVSDACGLTDIEMQKIAREMNCSETAFVFPSENQEADFKVRFFTPTEEVDLCGHATIATFYVLVRENRIPLNQLETIVKQETKAGILEVGLFLNEIGEIERIVMSQSLPKMMEINKDIKEVSQLLGLQESDLQLNNLPMQVVSTGLPDLMVPVKDLATLKKASPDFKALGKYQKEKGFISIHAFTFETEHKENHLHTRDFAPSVNIDEEAATGTANGALAAYLVAHKAVSREQGQESVLLKIEQGYTMDRPSEIIAEVILKNEEIMDVMVGGKAVIVLEGHIIF